MDWFSLFFMPNENQKTSVESALRELHGATEELMQIVEGVRSQRWVGDLGGRLKDTPEWCRFYVARCAVNRAQENQ